MKSELVLGNYALRGKKYLEALQHYRLALSQQPDLAEIINANIKFIENKLVVDVIDQSSSSLDESTNKLSEVAVKIEKNDVKTSARLTRVRAYNAQKVKRVAKLVVYTAIIDGYDLPILPELIVDEWDYVIFTDYELTGEHIFEVRRINLNDTDPVRCARFIKTHPHSLLAKYDYTLWVDGNILLKSGPLYSMILSYMTNATPAVFRRHPARQCIYEEILKCQELKKDDFGTMYYQVQRYLDQGVPKNAGLFETNVIFRNNRDPLVHRFNVLWWSEIARGSRRDQLSVNYACRIATLPFLTFPESEDIRHHGNPLYLLYNHIGNEVNKKNRYLSPDFFQILHSNRINCTQVDNNFKYSSYQEIESHSPKKVQDLVLRLYDLGFSKQAYEELQDLWLSTSEQEERMHAGWQIMLFDSSSGKVDRLLECLDIGRALEQHSLLSLNKQNVQLIRHEVSNRLKKITHQASEHICQAVDSSEFDVLRAHVSNTVEEKLKHLNHLFCRFGLSSIRFQNNSARSWFDSLAPEIPKGKSKLVMGVSLVTIIVPAFNAENTIETTIFSLVNQTWENIEIIVVDDCSTDKTYEILIKLAKIDKRIKILKNKENSGPYFSRNAALRVATGEFITVADADDWNHPQKIEFQATYLTQNLDQVANTACWLRATENLSFLRRNKPRYIQLNISSLMFRRTDVLDVLGRWDNVRFGGDSEFYKRVIRAFGKERVRTLTGVTSIGRIQSSSLTENPDFGYQGYPFGSRREYLESYEYFHRRATIEDLKFHDLHKRMFPVPGPMTTFGPANRTNCDAVIISDLRHEAECNKALWLARHLRDRNLQVRFVHSPRYDLNPRLRVHDTMRKVLTESGECLIVHGENVSCRILIVFDHIHLHRGSQFFPTLKPSKVLIYLSKYIENSEPPSLQFLGQLVEKRFQSKASIIVATEDSELLKAIGPAIELDREFTSIISIDVRDLDRFIYTGSPEVAFIMPSIDQSLSLQTAEFMLKRAGYSCTVLIVNDSERIGFVKVVNAVGKLVTAEFVGYVASDAYPGRNWLAKAVQQLRSTGKGLLGFNDGKWDGRIASFGLVRRSWVVKFYGADILHSGYRSHKADNEITLIAKIDNNYVYDANSVLVEYDMKKESGGSNPVDDAVFEERFITGFHKIFPIESVAKYAPEYKIKKETLAKLPTSHLKEAPYGERQR
jgi:glycosyltransferase involved in cell wall biosynthesis